MDIINWEIFDKFVFFGFDGIMVGVFIFYFVFFGFDIINFVSEEIDNLLRVVLFVNFVSMYIGVFIYFIIVVVLMLIIFYNKFSFNSFLIEVFGYIGFEVGKYFVVIGGFFGMIIVLFIFNYVGICFIYVMVNDGFLF